MRVLVTGAGGFVGSAVVRALLAERHQVAALRGPGDSVRVPRADLHEEIADIRDLTILRRLAKGADLVVHAAGPPSVRQSFDAPLEYAAVHVAGTATVAEACAYRGVKRLIHISSAEVYGPTVSSPVDETAPLHPASPYAAAKTGAEAFTHALAQRGHCSVICASSVFGLWSRAVPVLATRDDYRTCGGAPSDRAARHPSGARLRLDR